MCRRSGVAALKAPLVKKKKKSEGDYDRCAGDFLRGLSLFSNNFVCFDGGVMASSRRQNQAPQRV